MAVKGTVLETAVPKLQITGFGTLSLTCGRKCIATFATRQVEELLGYLLLNQQLVHSRDELIELLWPLDQPVDSRGSLSTVLWRLRTVFRQLGLHAQSFLDTTRDTVALQPQCQFVFDVNRFEQAMMHAKSEKSLLDKEVALKEAAALYKGDLFPSIPAAWCLIERERLSHLHLRALGQLMFCCMEHKSYLEALDLSRQILLKDPYREEVYRAKMVCYANLGDRAQVANQFKQCSDTLMSQLKIMPSRQTVDTFQRLIQSSIDCQEDAILQQAFRDYQQASSRLMGLLSQPARQEQR